MPARDETPVKIDPLVFCAKFPERCRLDLCRSRCCRYGVWVDEGEREHILSNAALFAPFLRPEVRDPGSWFGRTEADRDCPSGVAVETRETGGYCVFYNPAAGCALQKGAVEAGLHEWALKPRFCVMFPLVVTGGTLTVDEDMRSLWCMKDDNRTHRVLDALRKEIGFLFDEEIRRKLGQLPEKTPPGAPRGPAEKGAPGSARSWDRPAPPPGPARQA